MTPKIAAVAFDMDGLMFNTEDLYDKVGEILLQRRGQHFTLELKLEMMGLPGETAFEIMRRRCDLSESVQALQEETDEIFKKMLPQEIETMPGLLALLDLLEANNIPKCVCTSSHHQFAANALGHFDLQPRFERVLTADDVTHGKPDPEVYLTAAEKFGIESHQMLVLEDSHTGSKAGAASGAFTIAVPTKHSREMDFSHVRYVANSLQDEFITGIFTGS